MPSKHATLLAAVVAFCWSVPSSAQQPPPYPSSTERMSRIEADYSASISRLNRASNWPCNRDPELRRTWALLGEWLSAYLDGHPAASAADVVASVEEFAARVAPPARDDDLVIVDDLTAHAIELRQGQFLVAPSFPGTGTFFVVERGKNGPSRVTWSMDRYASSKAGDGSLSCWASADCGPLSGSIASLPPMATGEPRFYVDAVYSGNGGTLPAQTSVWAWNGQEARLLAVHDYYTMIGDDRRIEFDGDDLTVPTKEEREIGPFLTNGASPDPAATWTLHITPDGIEDRGVRWRDEELYWLDQFLKALLKGEPTSRWADPAVSKKLLRVRSDLDSLLMDWKVTLHGRERQLLIEADPMTLTFTLVERHHQLYATAVEIE